MSTYASSDYVCANCFDDEGIKDFISNNAESERCSFCGAAANEPIAAPFDEVVEHMNRCIGGYYDDPANTLPYESAEGGYQGMTYTTQELLIELGLDFPNDSDNRLHDAICQGLDNELWSDAEPFSLSGYEQLRFSWEEFCRVIRHRRRYFFLQGNRDADSELYSPGEVLKLIFSYAEEARIFVTLPRGTHLFRARSQPTGKSYVSAATLGPPPVEHAIKTNRMSPPGVVMMYVSDDPETALAETADKPGKYAVGEFVTEREAFILDLTRLPPVPSIFTELPDTLEYDPRPRLNFLHQISWEISRPIARDDRIHIEYVPTQVVTEYLRTAITIEKRRVDGIRYQSSRGRARTSLVLFADQESLILEKEEQPEFYHLGKDRWLRLLKASVKSITDKEINAWASKRGGLFGDT